jgi:hypothetical protein
MAYLVLVVRMSKELLALPLVSDKTIEFCGRKRYKLYCRFAEADSPGKERGFNGKPEEIA